MRQAIKKTKIFSYFSLSFLLSMMIVSSALGVENIVSTEQISEKVVKDATKTNRHYKRNYDLNGLKQHFEGGVEQNTINLYKDFEVFDDSAKIDLPLREIEVGVVLKIIAEEGGKNIILDESVKGFINADLKNISLNEALKLILISQELEARFENDTIIVGSRDSMSKKGLNRKFVKAFKLNNSNAVEVAQILEASVFNKGYDIKENTSSEPAPSSTPQIPAQDEMMPPTGQNVASTSDENTLGQSTLSDSKVLRGKIEEIEPGNSFGDAKTLASEIKVQYKKAITKKITVSNNNGGAIVIPDTRTNSILVAGLKTDIAIAEQAIKYLDKPLDQVAIEVSLIEITREDMKNLGASYDTSNGRGMGGFNSIANNGLHGLGTDINQSFWVFNTADKVVSADIYARINTLFQEEKAKLLANPTVTALDGSESMIKITDQIVSKFEVMVTQTSASYEVSLADVGIVVNILPKVGKDGFITMRIRPSISTSLPKIEVGDFGAFVTPISTREVIIQDTRIKSGQTLAIAGLLKDSELEKKGKVPFFSSIPVLGYLFKAKQHSKTKTELVILITPKILDYEGVNI